ncbi:LysM peptidoglycan-binding domain-containing protein [Catenovulum maritimum]|uniref:LysM domain-containing protein n=1 Tax=Catenovulum maritimum TaxID=1513271 RepID=A0A0J8GXX9_9ALTE|nr:LysM peptidoglycan-binding domain-containing protein [Catenovulum maritimum]KMT66084.1 hypothetical protein XM47_06485 [Catenovulum maritimum]
MFKNFKYFVLFYFAVFSLFADVLKIRHDAPQEYVVKKGDTLWDISEVFLNTPWKWPKLWGMNPQIDNPHLIYPGDVLALIYDKDGQPRLVVKESKKIVKLSPSKRISYKDVKAINTIPLSVISPYLNYERALIETEYNQAAMVIGGDTNTKNKIDGDLLYASGELEVGHLYGIYRKVREYNSGLFNTTYAEELVLTGTARAIEAEDDSQNRPARLRVLTSKQEIRSGDRLMSLLRDQTLPAIFTLSAPAQVIEAEILTASTNVKEFAKLEVVVINAGTEQGLKPGNVLGVYRQSPDIIMDSEKPIYVEDAGRFARFLDKINPFKQYDMPMENIGKLVVFKTYNNLSYALITDTQKALTIGDTVGLPE